MNPYPETKPSGVDWLGEVPAHWEVKRISYVVTKVGSGKTPSGGAKAYDTEGIPFLRSQNIYGDGLHFKDVVFISEEIDREMENSRVKPNDVLLNITGASLGRSALAPESLLRANVNQHVCIIRPMREVIDPRFMQRVISSEPIQAQIFAQQSGSSREGLNFQQVRAMVFACPPLEEQRAIVRYLDAQAERLNALAEAKRAFLERLAEKRAALIARAVTRGLPPNAARAAGLDPAPDLQDSGVDWLGEVPAHWEVRRFSHLVEIAQGQVDPELEPFASMDLIAPNHIESATGRLLLKETAQEQAAISGKYLCRQGDVIYSKIRPALAKVAVADAACLCSADMYPLTPDPDLLASEFLFWFMLSKPFTDWSKLESERVAMPKVNRETLNAVAVLLPPLEEQRAIAAYLDRETARIDALGATVEAALERLGEYRQALITAAVTGRIDVREAAV